MSIALLSNLAAVGALDVATLIQKRATAVSLTASRGASRRKRTMEATERVSTQGQMAAAISTGLVQLHRRYYGKGPTKAKTYFVHDTVVCFLEGGFTTVERTLIDEGEGETVNEMRRSFQTAMEDQFTRVVEEASGRKVIAYMSQIHQDPDLAVELFVLEPGERVVLEYEAELGGDSEHSDA
jgi:uncharacterized protein YbcI